VLYMITRYMALVDSLVLVVFWLHQSLNAHQCELLFNTGSWFLFAGIVVAQWIICIRTYAVWGQSKRVLVVLMFMILATESTSIFLMHEFMSSLKWSISPFPLISRCNIILPEKNRLYVDYGLIMSVELVVIILTVLKGVKQWKLRKGSALVTVLYRDGAMYFICLFVISMANFVMYLKPPSPLLSFVLPEQQRIMHSVLTSRIIINLREAAHAQHGASNITVETTLHYYVPPSSIGGSSTGTDSSYDSELTTFRRKEWTQQLASMADGDSV